MHRLVRHGPSDYSDQMQSDESNSTEPAEIELKGLEPYGYSPEAIALLGFSTLRGIGFQALRTLGGAQGIVALLSRGETADIQERMSSLGVRAGGVLSEFRSRSELRRHVWSAGLKIAEQLIARRIEFLPASAFPIALADLSDDTRPLWLFFRGSRELFTKRSVAVVGTRQATPHGEFLTRYAVSVVGGLDTPVVSGLAQGIDTLAHRCCLEAGIPTISVLGSGLLVPYPAKNIELADLIVEHGGLLISEYLPDQQPSAESFVWRNRLQACLSSAVIAAEWRRASGTAHTIRFARELGRSNMSLSISNIAPAADGGTADSHFDLPRMHEQFVVALQDALRANRVAVRAQAALF